MPAEIANTTLSIRERLGKILQDHRKTRLSLAGYTSSAVLVPLFLKNGKYHLLFTQRSFQVRDHKGQISFPGGVYEKKDRDLKITALRETEEEIGLNRKSVDVLGELGEIYTPTRYRIHPFVGLIPHPYVFRVNRKEIAGLIEVPLEHLMKEEHVKFEAVEFFDRDYDNPSFRFREHTIWGATGKITRELIGLLRREVL